MLWNVLDLPHDADQLVNTDEVLPEGVEQTAYRERLPGLTARKMWWRGLRSTCSIQGSQITPIKLILEFNFLIKNRLNLGQKV